jgi:uncharacterized membrane protein
MTTTFSEIDEVRIADAIAAAEKNTSAEIRVFVTHKKVSDPLATASKQFLRLDMQNTAHRNAVLIFLAPRSRNFAIVGDTAIHSLAGESFWNQLAAEMTPHFKNQSPTQALLLAIQKAGQLLSHHFPRCPDDQNELPDTVARD